MSATKEEIVAFMASEFPHAKYLVEAVGDHSSTLSHEIGIIGAASWWHGLRPCIDEHC